MLRLLQGSDPQVVYPSPCATLQYRLFGNAHLESQHGLAMTLGEELPSLNSCNGGIIPDRYAPALPFRDPSGNDMLSINVVVGDDEETYTTGSPNLTTYARTKA